MLPPAHRKGTPVGPIRSSRACAPRPNGAQAFRPSPQRSNNGVYSSSSPMSGFAKSVSVGVIGHGRQEANAPGARGRFCARRCRPAGQPADPERGATRIRRAMPKVATEGGGKENPTLYISRQWHREERLALSSLRRRGAAVQGVEREAAQGSAGGSWSPQPTHSASPGPGCTGVCESGRVVENSPAGQACNTAAPSWRRPISWACSAASSAGGVATDRFLFWRAELHGAFGAQNRSIMADHCGFRFTVFSWHNTPAGWLSLELHTPMESPHGFTSGSTYAFEFG